METVYRKSGQSAMEYLMTYGWAILVVVIVAAALIAMGVFSPATFTQSAATGFSGFQVPTGGWKLDTGGVTTLQLQNTGGSRINITAVQVTQGTTVNTNSTATELAPNSRTTYLVSGFGSQTAGSAYSLSVRVTYNNLDSGLTGFISTGTLTGTVG